MRSIATRPPYLVCLIVASVLMLYPFRACANDGAGKPFVGFTKYVRYRVHYDVNADGSHVETHEWALKVLTDQGVSEADEASVSFSDSLQSAEILSAYTLKKDGRRINVPPSNFQDETNKGKGKASPMFSDIRTKTVAFPDVAVGDTTVMSYKLTQKKPTFPGNFSLMESFSKFEAYEDVEISLSAPASLSLRVYKRGVAGGEIAPKNDRRNWLWSYKNERIAVPEAGSVSSLDYGPLIIATTFKDYGAIAAAYNARARAKAAPTANTRKLANELTLTAHTPREQAKALYEWVANNIEFAGNCVGVGSVVPHNADLVLANRMGDCKDHAALLQSLLSAKGISSTPALLDSGAVYTLPEVPTPDVFNHIINYIPALKLYVDSTARYTPFGSLPFGDSDKPVIYTADFNGIQHTPATNYKDNGSYLNTVLNIHPDGSADGETKFEVSGILATGIRAAMNYLQPNMEDAAVRRALARNGYTGTGTLIKGDSKAVTASYSYAVKYQLEDVMNLPGPGAVFIHPPFTGAGTIGGLIGEANEPDRTVNYQCYGGYSKEAYTIRLPKGVEVQAMPKDIRLDGKNLTYKATYELKGNTVSVVREIENRTAGNVCTPKDATALKAFARPVLRDLRAQLLYR